MNEFDYAHPLIFFKNLGNFYLGAASRGGGGGGEGRFIINPVTGTRIVFRLRAYIVQLLLRQKPFSVLINSDGRGWPGKDGEQRELFPFAFFYGFTRK